MVKKKISSNKEKEPCNEEDKYDLYKVALHDARNYYAFFMKSFDDIKSKIQIYLFVSSLIFAFSISNSFIISRIVKTDRIIFFFILGLILIIISIILLIKVLRDKRIEFPEYMATFKFSDKLDKNEIIYKLTKKYDLVTNKNIKLLKRDRKYIRWAENLLVISAILILFSIIYVLI